MVRTLCHRMGATEAWLPLVPVLWGLSPVLWWQSKPVFPKTAVETLPHPARTALAESTFPKPHLN